MDEETKSKPSVRKRAEAIKAYETALTAMDQAAGLRRLVELKLIDAGGKAPAAPEA